MAQAPRAAVYTRLSYSADDGSETLTHARQRDACLELAERLGAEVVAEYSDTDSAYTGKPRRGLEQALQGAEGGEYDVLLVWAADRLTRRVADLTMLTERLTSHVRVVTFTGSDIDLSSSEGLFNAQIMGAVAEMESRRRGERVAARIHQRATKEMRMAAGGRRQFGWAWADPDPDNPERPRRGSRAGCVPHPTEAGYMRQAYEKVAAGASLTSVARWLNEMGQTGPTGAPFMLNTLRSALRSSKHAGLVTYRGQLIGEDASGLRIIEPETWHAVQRVLDSRARGTRSAMTLLAGLIRCGFCGASANASTAVGSAGSRVAIYKCRTCHRTRRRALVEPAVIETVTAYLNRNAGGLSIAAPGPKGSELAAEAEALRGRLESLAAMFADGTTTAEGFAAADRAARSRLAQIERQAARAGGRPATAALAGDRPGDVWRGLVETDLDRARAVLAELIETVAWLPGKPYRPTLADVAINWRIGGAE